MTPQEALTQAGKDYWLKTEFDWEREAILDIEQEAATQERERLRALYLASEMRYCADVWHVHNHERCNGRCWGSWADPENCPDVCGDPFADPEDER